MLGVWLNQMTAHTLSIWNMIYYLTPTNSTSPGELCCLQKTCYIEWLTKLKIEMSIFPISAELQKLMTTLGLVQTSNTMPETGDSHDGHDHRRRKRALPTSPSFVCIQIFYNTLVYQNLSVSLFKQHNGLCIYRPVNATVRMRSRPSTPRETQTTWPRKTSWSCVHLWYTNKYQKHAHQFHKI